MPNDSKLIEVMARAICNHEDGDERHIDWHTKVAQAALDAIAEAGYAVVPREPTPKMIDATWDDPIDQLCAIESQNARNVRVYKAMLSAAALAGRE